MSDKIIVDRLTKSYPKKADAIQGLSFEIPRGCAFALLGRNGAGKTTALKSMSGYLYPDAGSCSIFGFDPYKDEVQVRSILAYVSDANLFYASTTPREILKTLKEFFPKYDEKLEREVVEKFKIELDKRLGTLSLGQLRIVNLLAALVRRPEVLVLDEPTLGLDVVARRDFMELVIDRIQADGMTVIFSSHMIAEIDGIVERAAIIGDGKLIIDAEVDKLRSSMFKLTVDNEMRLPAAVKVVRELRSKGKFSMLVEGDHAQLEAQLNDTGSYFELEVLPLEELFICLTGG